MGRFCARTPFRLLAYGLVAFGICLRVGFLGIDSFWLDEAFSVGLALTHDSAGLLTGRWDPLHPPLYYVILRGALLAGGVSEAAARVPSALASVLNLGLLFILAMRLPVSRFAAGLAVVLLALAPIDIWYAQEARMYALVTAAALMFALGLVVRSWWGVVLGSLGLTIGLYLDFTMVPLSMALTSIWFARWWSTGKERRDMVRIAVAWSIGWALFRPLWPQLMDVVSQLDGVTFFSRVRLMTGASSLTGPAVLIVLLLITIGLTTASAVVLKGLRNDLFRQYWSWVVPSAFLFATVLLTVPRAYSAKQILVTGWPFVILVAAWTLTDCRHTIIQRKAGAPLARLRLGAIVAVSIIAAIAAVLTPRADWRGVVTFLNRQSSSQTFVWIDPPWNKIPYDYYNPNLPAMTNPIAAAGTLNSEAPGHGDICLVAERSGAAPPTSPSEAWLDRHLRLITASRFARLEVRCYRNR